MPITVDTFETIDRAAEALASGQDAVFFGGGTLLVRAVNYAENRFTRIVRTTDAAMRTVEPRGRQVTIGAGVTMSQILATRAVDFLAPVAQSIGGPAVRNMGTVGGNIFAHHPYGDFAVALLALNARVHLAGRSAASEIALDDLLRNRDDSARRLVTAVTVERPDPGVFRYLKVSRTKPKGASVMSIAAWLPISGGRVNGARIAYGAMSSRPMRVPAVERALEGRMLDLSGIAPALAVATEGVGVPDDALASAWYRRQVAPIHLRRLLLDPKR